MLTLQGIVKSYGGHRVLGPLDLEIASGQTTVLIGPSGCGKSTLLRIMIGLIAPGTGTVTFGGTRLDASSILLARRRIGYVIQDGGLFPHLTARGNAALMAGYLGWDAGRIEARLNALCELTRFPTAALDRYPLELSGGQKQRVSLMRALLLEPELLLLDEPLAALDPMVRTGLQADLRRIFRSLGTTVVMVTHDLREAAYFADRIVLMREGAIVQIGSLEDFARSPADPFVTVFLTAQRGPADGSGRDVPELGALPDARTGPIGGDPA